mgnify:CR=1 FL=1
MGAITIGERDQGLSNTWMLAWLRGLHHWGWKRAEHQIGSFRPLRAHDDNPHQGECEIPQDLRENTNNTQHVPLDRHPPMTVTHGGAKKKKTQSQARMLWAQLLATKCTGNYCVK